MLRNMIQNHDKIESQNVGRVLGTGGGWERGTE